MSTDADAPADAEPETEQEPEPDGLSYAAAVEELEALLEDLERDDVDVDELAAKVKRAAALIRLCRRRITDARVDIDRIVAELDP